MHESFIPSVWLGRVDYQEAWDMQQKKQEEIKAGNALSEIFLLEHPDVITMGRHRDVSSLGPNPETLPFPVVYTNRGGQATWHGPGQLVSYPVIDLRLFRMDLHWYLRVLEEAIILTLKELGIQSGRLEGKTGVWVEGRKIASIGVGVRSWITQHGIALNVDNRLDAFQSFTPCGISGVEMTSIARESGNAPTVEKVGELFVVHLNQQLNFPAL